MSDSTWLQSMRRGFAELSVLMVLSRGESYGYDVLRQLGELDHLAFTESTLYPMLSKLTAGGLLTVREGPSDRGKNRRYYQITRSGKRRLNDLLGQWSGLRSDIDTLIEGKGRT